MLQTHKFHIRNIKKKLLLYTRIPPVHSPRATYRLLVLLPVGLDVEIAEKDEEEGSHTRRPPNQHGRDLALDKGQLGRESEFSINTQYFYFFLIVYIVYVSVFCIFRILSQRHV